MPEKSASHENTAERVKQQLRRYRPGRRVYLIDEHEGEDDPYLTVFPVQLENIGEYFDKIAGVVQKVTGLGITIDTDTGKPTVSGQATLITHITRFVIQDLLGLVDKCCQPGLFAVNPDHDALPKIVSAWVEENLLGDRLNPWKREMKTLIERMTNGAGSLSALLSRPSSPAATHSKISSIDELPDDLIVDGVTQNFGGIFQPPTQPLQEKRQPSSAELGAE